MKLRMTAIGSTGIRKWWSGPAALLVAIGAHAAPPQVDTLSETTLARSGRVQISGSSFGSAQPTSRVLIDGLPAIATTWTDTEIHAYVPEQASLGQVLLQVVTAEGASGVLTPTVTLRQSGGRVRWAFQMDSVISGQFTAVGADGTVYATDNLRLYALTPDGALQWVLPGAGGGRPISIGADGTIYTGAGPVHAVNPDGTLRWSFMPPGWPSLVAGPSLGPDGNIYAAQNSTFSQEELNMFSLDPDGNLRWFNNDEPLLLSSNGDNSAIKFGSDRLYVGVVQDAGAPPSLHSFDMDGNQLWYSGDLGISGGTHPQLDPLGRVIFRWGQVGLQALSSDGSVEWISPHPDNANLLVMPAIDAAGVMYTGGWLGISLWSVNPDGSTRWAQPAETGTQLINLALTPDDALLFAGGGGGAGGGSGPGWGWVRGYDAGDGTVMWQEDLPPENGFFQMIWSLEQTFTPDSQTAYFTTRFGANGANGYVYAIDTGSADPTACPADADGNGAVNVDDLVMVMLDFGCHGPECAGDVNGDGAVSVDDLVELILAWGSCAP